jgi:hypothetical protein
MLAVTHPNQDDINIFAKSIEKKTKRLYRNNYKNIIKQAIHISPAYRDFVNKLLSNTALKIKPYSSAGRCHVKEHGESNNYSKRRKMEIYVNFRDPETFAHELGHATDFLFGDFCSFSSHVIVRDGKTLEQIFREEFEEKEEELYKEVMREYANNVDSNIYKGAYDLFAKYLPLYVKLDNTNKTLERKAIHKELYESGFVEVYYQIIKKKCFDIVEQKYSPIMDALSSKYDISYHYLRGHSIEYYNLNKELLVQEFFANLFKEKVTGNHTRFDNLIKLMPKSFNAFERLFVIIYDHIMNNKRFNDLVVLVKAYAKNELEFEEEVEEVDE